MPLKMASNSTEILASNKSLSAEILQKGKARLDISRCQHIAPVVLKLMVLQVCKAWGSMLSRGINVTAAMLAALAAHALRAAVHLHKEKANVFQSWSIL